MNRVDTKIGNRIKSVREAKKMTVEDIKKETGLTNNIRVSRFPLRCRDVIISNDIHSVIIRSGESLTHDWEVRTPGYHPWTTYLHDIPQEEIMCSHRQVRSEGKRGLLLSVELGTSVQ